MSREWIIVVSLLVIASSIGCNRRCNSPILPRPFASNARIPAPGTGNLQIPSRMASGEQPYYVPGSPGGTLSQAINPNQAAPTLAANPENLNGWSRVAQSNLNNPNYWGGQAPNYNQIPTSYAASPNSMPGYRVATSSTLNNNQVSNGAGTINGNTGQFRQSDSSPGANDPSRIPASDASGSRAPSQLITNAQFQAPQYQTPFQQQRYTANINVFQPLPYNGNPNNGITPYLPQAPIRYQAELMAGQSIPYQSPYARTANADPYQHSVNGRPTNSVGWNPR